MSIGFYLAGSFNNKIELGKLIEQLEDLGHKCTWNWTKVEQTSTLPEQLGEYAKNDLLGVQNADIVVAVINDNQYAYRGTYCELGCAIGLGKKVFVICDDSSQCYFNSCVFAWHPSITRLKSWEEFLSQAKGST